MNELARVNAENPVFTTMVCETMDDKKVFYNAVENPVGKISDLINKELKLTNVYMQFLESAYVNEDTGEVSDGVKVVLIDERGQGWFTRSKGIVQSLQNIFTVFGFPQEWGEPLTVLVRQVDTANGRTFKLEVV